MAYDPRTIAFLAEVLYQPINLQVDRAQQIHNRLYTNRDLSYHNFQVAQDGIHLSNTPRAPGAISAMTMLPDRIVVREELTNITVEDFATRLVNVVGVAFQSLEVATSLAQQFVVRSLITPRHWDHSTRLLCEGITRDGGTTLATFGRPVASAGLRLTFPQTEATGEVFNLRMETWNQEPRSLWVECTGSYTRPLATENLPSLSTGLYATYKFLTGKACRFVEHYDVVP